MVAREPVRAGHLLASEVLLGVARHLREQPLRHFCRWPPFTWPASHHYDRVRACLSCTSNLRAWHGWSINPAHT
jgi:hypothetical protein